MTDEDTEKIYVFVPSKSYKEFNLSVARVDNGFVLEVTIGDKKKYYAFHEKEKALNKVKHLLVTTAYCEFEEFFKEMITSE
jgi:hypothetical protein